MVKAITLFLLCLPLYLKGSELSVEYELLDETAFRSKIVGNTVVGLTRQSNSLYQLYFALDGTCELLKQNAFYAGSWWIDKDDAGRDVVHAFWPDYQSLEAKSLFNPQNPRYGSPTSILYYMAKAPATGLLLVTKSAQAAAILLPGKKL